MAKQYQSVKVKLRNPETSLYDDATAWGITLTEEKATPKAYSKRIRQWIDHGALIPLSEPDANIDKYRDLLDSDTTALTPEATRELAVEINTRVGKNIIPVTETDKGTILTAIATWKASVLSKLKDPAGK